VTGSGSGSGGVARGGSGSGGVAPGGSGSGGAADGGPAVRVRAATASDVPVIHALIVELATYEQAPDQVTGTVEQLRQSMFGPSPSAEALLAEIEGQTAGFALFHGTFSTWECRPGIWLEDLYVRPQHRRAGVGGVLLVRVAQLTLERGGTRLEWNVLDWNEPALDFYERLGALRLSDWELHRLDGDALQRAAGAEGGAPDG
jgi:GNAT superfamily N-acetyltransferase